jgi:molybdopterin converting factor small subunit
MAKVVFTGNIQRHVACPPGEAHGGTVRDVLEIIFAGNPTARGYVLDEHGNLRKHMAIYLNGEAIADRTGLSDAVTEKCEIYIMQALSGG